MYLIIRPKKIAALALVLLSVVLFVGAALHLSDASAFSQEIRIPIVMYHQVSEDPKALGKYVVSVQELEADLIWLRDRGYTTLTVSDLIHYSTHGEPFPEKSIVLTFDDGQESFYAYVYPLLQKYDMCALVNIVGEFVDRYSALDDHDLRYSCMTWSEIEEMAESGFVEIGNHTYSMHGTGNPRYGCTRLSGESAADYASALRADVSQLQTLLAQVTGQGACTFAYPFGMVSTGSREVLTDMGFRALLTCEEHLNDPSEPDWLLNLGRFNRPSGTSSQEFFTRTMGIG